MKKLLVLAFVLLSSTAQAGYYGRQFNWNPYHPWHSWHAPRPYYENMYRWGYNRGRGWGRCYYAARCGW